MLSKTLNLKFLLLLSLFSNTISSSFSIINADEEQPRESDVNKTSQVRKKGIKKKKSNRAPVLGLAAAGMALLGIGTYLVCNNCQSHPKSDIADHAPKSAAESRIIGFYSDTMKIDVGSESPLSWVDVINILKNNDRYGSPFFEGSHKFIQWLFPTVTPSQFNNDSEVLTGETINIFKSNPNLVDKLAVSFETVVHGYYKLRVNIEKQQSRSFDKVTVKIEDEGETTKAFLVNGGHNLLRITRILNSLKLLGIQNYAKAFFQCLSEISTKNNKIAESMSRWRQAYS